MARSLDLSKLIRGRSVYNMCLCKAKWGIYATKVCPTVWSPGVRTNIYATKVCPVCSESRYPGDVVAAGEGVAEGEEVAEGEVAD